MGRAFSVGYIKWMLSESLILINVFYGEALIKAVSMDIPYMQREWSRDLNRYLYTHVHNSIVYFAKMWKQPKCPSTGEWIDKLCSIHIMKCYLAIKRDETLINGGQGWIGRAQRIF